MEEKHRSLLIGIFCLFLLLGIAWYVYPSITGGSPVATLTQPELQPESEAKPASPGDAPPVSRANTRGTYVGESFVGQYYHEGRIAKPKSATNKYQISTVTDSKEACEKLKLQVYKACHPVSPLTADKTVSTIGHFCSFDFTCPHEVIQTGQLSNIVQPEDIEPVKQVFIESVKSWGLDRIDQPDLPLNNKYQPEYDGEGQLIYVIDTGINTEHDDFKGRYLGGANFIESDVEDKNGHGTHCAGTALGSTYGVAPKAQLKGVKVLGEFGSGESSGVIKGIEWAFNDWKTNHKNKGSAILSMSLGSETDNGTNRAAKAASSGGMIVVVAAGNANANACGYSPAGEGGKGASGGIITVMSSTDNDRRSSFSCYGECTDIIAPGSDIISAWIGSKTASNSLSGTSMACPHVAGACAQLLQKHGGDKDKAIKELFTINELGKISDIKIGSFNRLLHIPDNTVVDGPIPEAPQPVQIKFKLGKTTLLEATGDFRESLFGEQTAEDVYKAAKSLKVIDLGTFDPGNEEACERIALMGEDMTGQITPLSSTAVILKRGGNCAFADKIKRAQERGAAMVFIEQDSNAVPLNPNCSQDCSDIKIFSGMVSRRDADDMRDEMKAGNDVMTLSEN